MGFLQELTINGDTSTVKEYKAGEGISIAPDGTISSQSSVPTWDNIQGKPTDLVRDPDYVHTDNNFTTTEKTKLAGLTNYDDSLVRQQITQLESGKQDKLTAGANINISGNVISATATPITVDSALSDVSENPVQNRVIKSKTDAIETTIAGKQDKLVAGANITITGNVISASGGGSGGTVDDAMSSTSTNAVQNKVINARLVALDDSISRILARLEMLENGCTSYTMDYDNGDLTLNDGTTTQRLPITDSPYETLEYIQTDGTAYIDTGLTLNGAYTLEFEGSIPTSGKIQASAVAHTSASMRQGFMVFNTSSHKVDYFWPGVDYSNLAVDAGIDFANKWKVVQDASGIAITQGAYSSSATYTGATDTDSSPIELLHSQNPNHASYTHGRLYSVKIRNGSTLVRDFVPKKRKSDNVIGLLDNVTSVFYTPANGGVFTGA